jgi:hypothetical protein
MVTASLGIVGMMMYIIVLVTIAVLDGISVPSV